MVLQNVTLGLLLQVVGCTFAATGLAFMKLSTEKDGDKSTSKSSSSSSTSTKSSTAPDIADFVKYVVAIDVKQHAASKTALTDMRNCHLRAIGLLEKNFKRLADPRGEGESGNGGNVMSMF